MPNGLKKKLEIELQMLEESPQVNIQPDTLINQGNILKIYQMGKRLG